jgi:hypothetical protein
LDWWERRGALTWSGWPGRGGGEPAGEVALEAGQVVATAAVADVTVGANQVLGGAVNAEVCANTCPPTCYQSID